MENINSAARSNANFDGASIAMPSVSETSYQKTATQKNATQKNDSEARSKRNLEILAKMRPIDDAFFERLIQMDGVCEEILRVILKDDGLKVKRMTPQYSIKNLYGRSVRLDAECELSNGKHCNVEVQKADDDDHFRRVRYNASCITANITEPGVKFENVPDLYMIYITEKDILKGRQTIYYAQQCILDSRQPIDDGLHIIYVNTAIDDGTLIAELMKNFLKTSVNSVKFPKLSEGVSYYKNNREGQKFMCSALAEAIAEERVIAEAIGEARGKAIGEAIGEARGVIKMGREFGLNDEEILARILKKTTCTEEQARELMQEH